jgi:ATP-binding cassette subfamily F protein uup
VLVQQVVAPVHRRLRERREAEEAAARAEREAKQKVSAKPATRPASVAGPAKLTWKEQRELEGLEAQIVAAEARRDGIAERLADPALYGNAGAAAAATEAFRAAEAEVEALYGRWAELEGRR